MRLSWLAVAAATVALGGSAHAATYTLESLVNGSVPSFTVGTLTFSNFTATATGPNAPNLNNLDVTTIAGGFYIAGSLTASGSNGGFGDLAVTYDVTATGGAKITDAGLSGTGPAVNGANWNIGETYINPANGHQVGNGLTVANGISGIPEAAGETFAGVTTLDVNKDIGWTGGSNANGFVDLSIVTQTFSENGAPGPVPGTGLAGLAALALAGLYTRARRA
jgi:hypothetical protein